MDHASTRSSFNRIDGTSGDDVLKGSRRRDAILGFQGNDQLSGRGSGDRLRGGQGNDLIRGGGGSDRIRPGLGFDLIRPGKGRADRIIGLADGDGDLVRFQAGRQKPLRFAPLDSNDALVLVGVATADIRIEVLRGNRLGIVVGNRLEAITRGMATADLRDQVFGSLG